MIRFSKKVITGMLAVAALFGATPAYAGWGVIYYVDGQWGGEQVGVEVWCNSGSLMYQWGVRSDTFMYMWVETPC